MAPKRKPSSVSQHISLLLGNVGNTTVIAVVGESLLWETGVVQSSDGILVNMAFSSLMVSLVRNTVVMVSDLGVETLMLVSSTTRLLMGCIWDFPSAYSGLAFATSSMVIHESLPICLMNITNLGSLLMLYTHGHSCNPANKSQDAPVITRIPAERRAAKVILALNVLFISSCGMNVISVHYFNYNRGSSTELLFIIARFANMSFIAFSPVVLAVGHRKLRAFIKSVLSRII